jgi:hypothetical protein
MIRDCTVTYITENKLECQESVERVYIRDTNDKSSLIPTKWKWHIDFEGVDDSDAYTIFLWHVKVLKAGLKAMGHTDVFFDYEGNYFTGNATEEIELPPDAIIL